MSEASPTPPGSYPDQLLGSTVEDSQGERIPKEVLEDLAAGMQNSPLQQSHDSSLPLVGVVSNARVVPHPDHPGEWNLMADVMITASSIDLSTALRGWSWSRLEELEGNDSTAEIRVYLPYPHYLNEEFIRSLREADTPVAVGTALGTIAVPVLATAKPGFAPVAAIGVTSKTSVVPWSSATTVYVGVVAIGVPFRRHS